MVKPQWIIYTLLMLLPIASQAQSVNFFAQMQKEIQQSAPDTHRVQLLLKLGSRYLYKSGTVQSDLDSAFLYLYEAKSLSETLQFREGMHKAMYQIIRTYNETGDMKTVRALCASLIDQYQKSGETAEEASIWQWLGTNMDRNDTIYPTNIYSLQQAGRCYAQINDKEKEIEALKEIADIHLTQGNLVKSEEELLKVLDMYKSIGFPNLHFTYDLLTSVSILRGNLDRALAYGKEMIRSMETTGDSIVVAETFYYRLAKIYELLDQTEQSVYWYKRAYSKSKDANVVSLTRGLIKLGKAPEALTFVQNVIRKSLPSKPGDKLFIANALGDCYDALKQYHLAEKYYLEMIQHGRSLEENSEQKAAIHLTISQFYVNKHRYSEAKPYLQQILTIPGGIATPYRLKEAHLLLFKVDSASGNYLSAIRHFQLHKLLNDSIVNVTKNRQIAELQIQYDTEKKEKDITLLQNESALQQIRLQEATLAKNFTFGGGSLLLVILGLLYNRYRLKQRSNRQLELQQIEINQTNRSLQNLVNEKELLLREIHHRVKNNLQIVMSLLNTQSAYLQNDAAVTAIRDSQQRIHSISLIHKKLYQSNNIAQINMPVYIQELVDYLRDSYGTAQSVRFDLNIDLIDLDVTQAVPIGLILNEAISNAVKYAFPDNRAGLVAISMQHGEGNQFKLTISDNGTGLPPGFDPRKSASLGMSLMRGLSKQLHGSFDLKNEGGLTINIVFSNDKAFQSSTRLQAAEMMT